MPDIAKQNARDYYSNIMLAFVHKYQAKDKYPDPSKIL